MMTAEVLQSVFEIASGSKSSHEDHILVRWGHVVRYVEAGEYKRDDPFGLAVDLHHAFVGEGHRTEIMHLVDGDPIKRGWLGVALAVMGQEYE